MSEASQNEFRDSKGIEGRMTVSIINKHTGRERLRKQYNHVTHLGKTIVTGLSTNIMLARPGNNARGSVFVDVPFIKNPSVPDVGGNVEGNQQELTCYLINSDEVLTEDSTMLPIFTTPKLNEIDGVKMLGYGNSNTSPYNNKNGVKELVQDNFAVEMNNIVSAQWRFDANQSNGTFNKICMGIGLIEKNDAGAHVVRGLNPTPIQKQSERGFERTYFLPPGVFGLTNQDEILIHTDSYENQNKSNAVLNLTTGKVTRLLEQDNRYGVDLVGYDSVSDYDSVINYVAPSVVVVDGKVYWETNNDIYKLNGKNKEYIQTPKSYEGIPFGIFKRGTYVYYATSGGSSITQYNTETGDKSDYVFNGNVTTDCFSKEGTTNQALMANRVISLANGNYLMSPIYPIANYGTSYVVAKYPFEFTDLDDIEGSIVKRYPKQAKNIVYNGVVGGKTYNISMKIEDSIGLLRPTGSDIPPVNYMKCNLFIDYGTIGNLISYIELPDPLTKTENDILRVTYEYRIV